MLCPVLNITHSFGIPSELPTNETDERATVCDVMQGFEPQQGLPKLRQAWVERRGDDGSATCTQMHYARRGIVTEEMAFVAAREQLPLEFVVSEVGFGAAS